MREQTKPKYNTTASGLKNAQGHCVCSLILVNSLDGLEKYVHVHVHIHVHVSPTTSVHVHTCMYTHTCSLYATCIYVLTGVCLISRCLGETYRNNSTVNGCCELQYARVHM